MNYKTKRRAIVAILASSPVWVKPVVDTVMLPAHAATTDDTGNASGGVPALTNKSFYTAYTEPGVGMQEPANESSNALFDAFISPAIAEKVEQMPLNMLVTLSEVAGKVVASSAHINQYGTVKYTASNIPTDATAAPTPLTQEASCSGGGHTHIKIVGYTFNASTISVEITTNRDQPRTQTLQPGTGSVTLFNCD